MTAAADDEDESVDRPKPVGCASHAKKWTAMQLTSLNRIAVISWVRHRKGTANIGREGIVVWAGDHPRHVYNTDWVIYLSKEAGFMIVPDHMFEHTFNLVDGPLPRERRRMSA